MKNYFLIHRWSPEDLSYVLYTEWGLRSLHRTFGYSLVRALERLLERSYETNGDTRTLDLLRKITSDCEVCRKLTTAPRRFRLTVGTKDHRCNHYAQLDTMFIQGRAILHMVDEATVFMQQRFYASSHRKRYGTRFSACHLLYTSVSQTNSLLTKDQHMCLTK